MDLPVVMHERAGVRDGAACHGGAFLFRDSTPFLLDAARLRAHVRVHDGAHGDVLSDPEVVGFVDDDHCVHVRDDDGGGGDVYGAARRWWQIQQSPTCLAAT